MTNCHWQCDEDTTPPYINDAVQYHWKTNHYLRGDIGEDWKAALSILSDSAPTETNCDQNQSGFYLAVHGHGLPHQIQLQLQAVDSRVRSRIISWQSDFQISNIVSDFSPRQGTSLHGHGLRAACAVQSILKKTDLTLIKHHMFKQKRKAIRNWNLSN